MSIDYKAVYERAYAFASEKHLNDKRNDGKTPYMVHVDAVIKGAEEILHNLEPDIGDEIVYAVKSIAALHDVVEDHPEITFDDLFYLLSTTSAGLEAGAYASNIIAGVKAITKRPKGQEEYASYVTRVKSHHWAIIVKIADLRHNMIELKPGSMRDKYSLTLMVLGDNLRTFL